MYILALPWALSFVGEISYESPGPNRRTDSFERLIKTGC